MKTSFWLPSFSLSRNHASTLEMVLGWLTFATLGLLPLIVVPVIEQPLSNSKALLFLFWGVLLGFGVIVQSIQRKTLSWNLTPFTVLSLIFGCIVLLSSFNTGVYPVEHLLGWGGIWIVWAMTLVILPGLLSSGDHERTALYVMVASSGILAIGTLLEYLGVGPSVIVNYFAVIDFPNSALFNQSGSVLVAAQIQAITLAALLTHGWVRKQLSPLELGMAAVLAGGLALSVWSLLPGSVATPIFLPWSASWNILIELIRTPSSALLGVGPEGFTNAFMQFRPLWLNQSVLWNVQFTQASSLLFSIPISLGISGMVVWVLLVLKLIAVLRKEGDKSPILSTMVLGTFVVQILFPATYVLTGLQAILMALWIAQLKLQFGVVEVHGLSVRLVKGSYIPVPLHRANTLVRALFLIVVTGATIAMTYALFRTSMAMAASNLAIEKSAANDAIGTYTAHQRAIQLNPLSDAYRRQYALTNLTISLALAQKTDRTEQENAQLVQLVQQAIRDARAATFLDPRDSNNWITLARIYAGLIGSAEGADQWAVASYVEAIRTNPTNPLIRIELGELFISLQQYEQAMVILQQAASIRPDLASAYYSYGLAAVGAQNYAEARLAYQETMKFLPVDSPEYAQVQTALNQLPAEPTPPAEASETRTLPAPTSESPSTGSATVLPAITPQVTGVNEQSTLTTQPATTPPESSILNATDL